MMKLRIEGVGLLILLTSSPCSSCRRFVISMNVENLFGKIFSKRFIVYIKVQSRFREMICSREKQDTDIIIAASNENMLPKGTRYFRKGSSRDIDDVSTNEGQ
jgi:hypothetical protein